jgi:hypothetical protein
MNKLYLNALLVGMITTLIVNIVLAGIQNLLPINSEPWLNSALGVKESISVNVRATTMTQASMPNTYISYPVNYFDYSGPFLQNGNGLQIGNSLIAQGFSAGVFVNEPSGMYSPLVLLAYNNKPTFTVDTGGSITANTVNANWGNFTTSVTINYHVPIVVSKCKGVIISTNLGLNVVDCGVGYKGIASNVYGNYSLYGYPCNATIDNTNNFNRYWCFNDPNGDSYFYVLCCQF